MTVCVDGGERVTVKSSVTVSPGSPSIIETSSIASFGVSSSVIVPSPCASSIVPPVGLDRLTKKVSSGSRRSSPFTETEMVAPVIPAGIVRRSDAAM